MRTLKRVILDTSAFIQGYNMSPNEEYYCIPEVLGELREELGKMRYEGALASGRLRETQPKEMWIRKIETKANNLGEAHKLSHTDKMLLALSLQLRSDGDAPIIVSDDYSIQNMASHLGIHFISQNTRGIKKEIKWSIYCPGCKKRFDTNQEDNICPICGTGLKRKPIRI